MKITRDDIKEMVTDVLDTLINENKINQTTIVFDYFKENPEDIYTDRPEVIASKLNIGVQSVKQVTTVWKKCEKYFDPRTGRQGRTDRCDHSAVAGCRKQRDAADPAAA